MFSRTLETADAWTDSRIVSGGTAEEIAKLKAELGKDLVAHGGTRFLQSLIKLGVVDEYRLWVLPAITGKGAPLVPELNDAVRLRQVNSTSSRAESSNWFTYWPTSKPRAAVERCPRRGYVSTTRQPGRRTGRVDGGRVRVVEGAKDTVTVVGSAGVEIERLTAAHRYLA